MLPLTAKCTQAIRIVEELIKASGHKLKLREMETLTHTNFHVLWEVSRALSVAQIVIASKGPNGGMTLSKEDVTVWDVVSAVETPQIATPSSAWRELEGYLERVLKRTPIRDLLKEEQCKG